jgi:PP-loop superfamily ATP-utilizing enzyme
MNVTDTVDKKEDRLVQIISAHNSVLVAFSGGVDSTYLLYKTV